MTSVTSLPFSIYRGITLTVSQGIHYTDIIASEGYATVRHVLPASIVWVWRKFVGGSEHIQTIKLEITRNKTTRVAYLNIHGNIPDTNKRPVILCHGDYGHPYTMLKYADIAKQAGHPTFSLFIPKIQIEEEFEISNELLNQGLAKMVAIMDQKNQGLPWYKRWPSYFKRVTVLGVGHSSGGIHLASRQFVAIDKRLKAMMCVGSALSVTDETRWDSKPLYPHVRRIHKGVKWYTNRPVVQIVAQQEYVAPPEAMMVRPKDHCFRVPGMHLSGLYKPETAHHFRHFFKEFG